MQASYLIAYVIAVQFTCTLADPAVNAQVRALRRQLATLETRVDDVSERPEQPTCNCTQPHIAFSAYSIQQQTVYPENFVRFDGILTNIGWHYNGGISMFTCPMSGVYAFSLSLTAQNGNKQACGKIVKNGQPVAYAFASQAETYGHYSHSSAYVIIECQANDNVWVAGSDVISYVQFNRFSTFSGHLLFAI